MTLLSISILRQLVTPTVVVKIYPIQIMVNSKCSREEFLSISPCIIPFTKQSPMRQYSSEAPTLLRMNGVSRA